MSSRVENRIRAVKRLLFTGVVLLALLLLALSTSNNLERDYLRATCCMIAQDVITRSVQDVRARVLLDSLSIRDNLFRPEDASETVLIGGPTGSLKPWIDMMGMYHSDDHTLAYGFCLRGGDECWVVIDSTATIPMSDSLVVGRTLNELRARLRRLPPDTSSAQCEEDSSGRATSVSYAIPRADVTRYALTCYIRTRGEGSFQLDLYRCPAWADGWATSGNHLDGDLVPRSAWEPEVLRLARRWDAASTDSELAYASMARRNLTQSVYVPLLGTTLALRAAAVVMSMIALVLSLLLHQHLTAISRIGASSSAEPWDLLPSHSPWRAGILSWMGGKAYLAGSMAVVLTPGFVGVGAVVVAIGRGASEFACVLLGGASILTAVYSLRNLQLLIATRNADRGRV